MTTHGGKKLIKAPRAAAVITTSALGRWKYALRARTAKAVTQRRKRRAPPTRKAASGIIVESSSRLITVPVGLPRSSCAVGRTQCSAAGRLLGENHRKAEGRPCLLQQIVRPCVRRSAAKIKVPVPFNGHGCPLSADANWSDWPSGPHFGGRTFRRPCSWATDRASTKSGTRIIAC